MGPKRVRFSLDLPASPMEVLGGAFSKVAMLIEKATGSHIARISAEVILQPHLREAHYRNGGLAKASGPQVAIEKTAATCTGSKNWNSSRGGCDCHCRHGD